MGGWGGGAVGEGWGERGSKSWRVPVVDTVTWEKMSGVGKRERTCVKEVIAGSSSPHTPVGKGVR